jgi:hypothetical protein
VLDVRLGAVKRFEVGVAVADMPVAFIPLAHVQPLVGRRFDGLLGQDFLGRFVIEIDYAARALRLHDPARFEYAGTGERLSFTSSMNLVAVEATVVQPGAAPATGRFVLDTGGGEMASLVLSAPFVTEHALRRPGQPVLSPAVGGHGAGGTVSADIGRVAELRLGAVALRDVLATFTRDSAGFFASAEFAGVIGNETLRRFRVFIDSARSEVILEPAAALDEPFHADASGLTLHAEGPDLEVARVASVDGTPAAEAGVQAGDVLLAIDGRPVSKVVAARDALREPGRRALSIRRGAETLTLTIEARRLI